MNAIIIARIPVIGCGYSGQEQSVLNVFPSHLENVVIISQCEIVIDAPEVMNEPTKAVP